MDVVSVVTASNLPARLVSKGVNGEPNGTMSKTLGLWLFPALTAGPLSLFALTPRIDPHRTERGTAAEHRNLSAAPATRRRQPTRS